MTFKPMLAATLDNIEDIKLPVYVSPKLDGIRCLIINGQAVSRSLKPIPNVYIQKKLEGLPDGLDGELMLYQGDFNDAQSAVMSEDGKPDFVYCIFDTTLQVIGFPQRLDIAKKLLIKYRQPIKFIEAILVDTYKKIYAYEKDCLERGYEGIICRSINSPYKFGRSTLNEGFLVKYKRFKDAEAQIIGFEELNRNTNEAKKDKLGHTERSAKKAGLIPAACLGSLWVYDKYLDKEFNIGTGFTQEQREEIWKNQKNYLGADITYCYQEVSAKGVPRFPSFKCFRII